MTTSEKHKYSPNIPLPFTNMDPLPPQITWETSLEMITEVFSELSVSWIQNYLLRSNLKWDAYALSDEIIYSRSDNFMNEWATIPELSNGFQAGFSNANLCFQGISRGPLDCELGISSTRGPRWSKCHISICNSSTPYIGGESSMRMRNWGITDRLQKLRLYRVSEMPDVHNRTVSSQQNRNVTSAQRNERNHSNIFEEVLNAVLHVPRIWDHLQHDGINYTIKLYFRRILVPNSAISLLDQVQEKHPQKMNWKNKYAKKRTWWALNRSEWLLHQVTTESHLYASADLKPQNHTIIRILNIEAVVIHVRKAGIQGWIVKI